MRSDPTRCSHLPVNYSNNNFRHTSRRANNPQEIRLDFNDAALSQVLKSIETQSRYTFFYNNDIDVTQSVSAHIASSDINSVVTAVLKGTDIAHRITDNRVVLFVGG